jgi:hypothetical protein
MDIDEIIALVSSWEDTVVLAPGPGSRAPEIAWGDVFFFYSPDASVPDKTQPFATIVTKNYPDDTASQLDRAGVFRLSVASRRTEDRPRGGVTSIDGPIDEHDPSTLDRLHPHPVYGSAGWVAVLNPGPRTAETSRTLLRQAYEAARSRYQRSSSRPPARSTPS